MNKINELQKVELLEEAVRNDDVDEVKRLFSEYKEFEFTARAIGLACRFASTQMLLTLLDNGASLSYEFKRGFKKKYEYILFSSASGEIKKDYSWYLLEKFEVEPLSNKLNSNEQRQAALQILLDRNLIDAQDFLYFTIIFDDLPLYEVLRKNGVDKISEKREDLVAGRMTSYNMEACGRYDKYVFTSNTFESLEKGDIHIFENLVECMNEKFIGLVKSDYYKYDYSAPNREKLKEEFCLENVFKFFIEKSSMAKHCRKMDIVMGLIEMNNASGLQYAIDKKWVKNKDIEYLVDFAMKKTDINPEIISNLLTLKKDSTKAKKKNASDEFSLEDKPLSVTELKKIWGFKKKDNGELIITSYKGNDKNVVIPSMIGKDKITEISADTFNTEAPRITPMQRESRYKIESVEFPSTIKIIPKGMFYERLSSVNDDHIGHRALKKIIINKGTKEISKEAFENCEGLEEIVLPKGLKEIGENAFEKCVSLKEIELPDSITKIGTYAFSQCENLEKINIPKKIEKLGYGAFSGCGFKEFILPENFEIISGHLLSDCQKLKSVTIPNTWTGIPENFFLGCTALSSIEIPSGIVEICEGAFSNCGLEEITIPPTVKEIKYYAFKDCKKLKNVEISDSTVLEKGVFFDCEGLADEEKRIIVNKKFYGWVNHYDYMRVNEKYIKSFEIPPQVDELAIDSAYLPPIVYRPQSEVISNIDFSNLEAGQEIEFGRFPKDIDFIMEPIKWRVLSIEDDKALLICVNSIMRYNGERYDEKSWEKGPIRKLLNGDFYNIAFSQDEKSRIVLTNLKNYNEAKKKTDSNADTLDNVFLLSLDELEKYMPTQESRKSNITSYISNQSKRTSYISRHVWTLRTLDSFEDNAIEMNTDGSRFISYYGARERCYISTCVRPAVVISLK